jgi:hypothetical protein
MASVEKMLVALSYDHHVALQYDASRGLWQIMTVGPINTPPPTKHAAVGHTLKEVVAELYGDLQPGTIYAG